MGTTQYIILPTARPTAVADVVLEGRDVVMPDIDDGDSDIEMPDRPDAPSLPPSATAAYAAAPALQICTARYDEDSQLAANIAALGALGEYFTVLLGQDIRTMHFELESSRQWVEALNDSIRAGEGALGPLNPAEAAALGIPDEPLKTSTGTTAAPVQVGPRPRPDVGAARGVEGEMVLAAALNAIAGVTAYLTWIRDAHRKGGSQAQVQHVQATLHRQALLNKLAADLMVRGFVVARKSNIEGALARQRAATKALQDFTTKVGACVGEVGTGV